MSINTEKPLYLLASNLWQREGGHCVSALVATLAKAQGSRWRVIEEEDIYGLTNQAFELSTPIDDWESAAREAGWTPSEQLGWTRMSEGGPLAPVRHQSTAREACEFDDIEPHQREVYEHWIVSDWLADQLAERGEKVNKDFAGLTIWARTTTGQAVYADAVIEDIARSLHQAPTT